jgi:hypothetical protein
MMEGNRRNTDKINKCEYERERERDRKRGHRGRESKKRGPHEANLAERKTDEIKGERATEKGRERDEVIGRKVYKQQKQWRERQNK